jgi:hypothetical protein
VAEWVLAARSVQNVDPAKLDFDIAGNADDPVDGKGKY